MSIPSHAKADLVLVLVTLIAAAGWIFSKESLGGLPPLLFIGVRFLLAGSVLLVAGRTNWPLVREPRVLGHCLLLGGVMGVALLFWIQALNLATHLGEGAFITSVGVLLIPLLGRLLFAERVPPATWLALPVAAVGLACLSLKAGFRVEFGQLLFLGAALLFALHFTLLARLAVSIPAVILTATQLLMVGLVGLCASLLTETWPTQVAPTVWGWVLASALIASSLRFALQTYGQGLASVGHTALIMTLEPVWTAILTAAWFGERMSAQQLLGCSLIFAAMLISRWRWVQSLLRPLFR